MEELYILLAEATAGAAGRYREGARHAMIIYTYAASERDAVTQAHEKLAERHWFEPDFKRVKILGPDADLPDETHKLAATEAIESLASIIVYNVPIKN